MGVDLTRKAGQVISRRHMWWQKLHHDRIAARTANVGLLSQGVYLQLRLKAGQTWNAGSMRLGDREHAKVKEVEEFIARILGGQDYKRKLSQASEILKELRAATLITWGTDKVVYIMDWADEQGQPPSMAAGRKRQERERRRSPHGDGSHGDVNHAPDGDAHGDEAGAEYEEERFAPARIQRDGDHAPRAPTPPSDSASTSTSGAFGSGEDVTKSHTREEVDKDEDEKRSIRSSNSTSIPTGLRPPAAESEGGVGRSSVIVPSDDIYALDPVSAACELTREREPWARNGFNRAFKRVGKEVFMLAIGELRQAQQDGVRPRTKWGGYLHGIIRKHEERLAAQNPTVNHL